MSNKDRVIAEQHTTAQSLMAALDLSSCWVPDNAWSCPWIFRGQRDADWLLTPAAWRSDKTVPLQRLALERKRFSEEFASLIREQLDRDEQKESNPDFVIKAYAQARAEFSLIYEFILLADELGHSVPSMDEYRRLASYDYMPDLRNLPHFRLLPEPNPAAALAQHHGIPTRSMDWTRNPFYAAYFAASEVNPTLHDGRIAIWAIRPDHLRSGGKAGLHNTGYTRFIDHTVPNSDNPYLHSQEGLFIHPTYGCAYCAKFGEFPSLEAFAISVERELAEPIIRKLTLPYSEVGELLRLLWLKGVSRAHLMPTMDNVTTALCSRWQWAS